MNDFVQISMVYTGLFALSGAYTVLLHRYQPFIVRYQAAFIATAIGTLMCIAATSLVMWVAGWSSWWTHGWWVLLLSFVVAGLPIGAWRIGRVVHERDATIGDARAELRRSQWDV